MATAKRHKVPVKPVESKDVVTLELSTEEAEDLMAVLMRRVSWDSDRIGTIGQSSRSIYEALYQEGVGKGTFLGRIPWQIEDHTS